MKASTPSSVLSRFIVSAMYVVVAAGAWDVWWHGAIGRDSFWEPPHLLLQAGVVATLATAVLGWIRLRDHRWKLVALAALTVPLSAPFDELWHRAFGVENLTSALVIWSPPHLLLVGGLIATLVLVLPVVRTDADAVARALFGSIAGAALLQLLLFLAVPLEPLGLYRLLGFWGSLFPALFLALVLIVMRTLAPAPGSATMTVLFYLVLASLSFGERLAPGITVPPHAHPPGWLAAFSFGVPAAIVDLAAFRWHGAVTGAVVGFLSAGILYGFSSPFLGLPFRFGPSATAVAVVSSVVGGALGGLLAQRSVSRRVGVPNGPRITRETLPIG